jgi:transposase-like protein
MIVCAIPLSLRNVEDLLFERGIDICHETARLWQNRNRRRRLDGWNERNADAIS